jgi:threonine aldolase
MATNHVDLRSDTVTRPTQAMRAAMAEAEVGDEQRGEDPTTNALCERVAALLGKEAGVFLPSGTMCNEIALLVHCRPGEEVISDRTAHIITAEGGGPGALAGVMVQPLDGVAGIFEPAQLADAVRPISRYAPRSRLVVVEQTSNLGGGTIWPLATIEAVGETAKEHGLTLHMDGARLLNASVGAGVEAALYAAPFDSVWLDFSKGLGCPVGAVLTGSQARSASPAL